MKHVQLLLFALGSFFLFSETHGRHSSNTLEEVKGHLLQSEDEFKCPFVFGSFADPEDCSHYYVCIAGKPFHKKCKKFLSFDFWTRRCVPSIIATCGYKIKDKSTTPVPHTTAPETTTEGNFVCTSFMGTFPHPGDCSKYYTCVLYRATMKTCPEKELFDAVQKTCQPADQVHCGTRRRPVDLTTIEIPDVTTDHETDATTDHETDATTDHETDATTNHETDATTDHETDATTDHETDATTDHETDFTSPSETTMDLTTIEITDVTTDISITPSVKEETPEETDATTDHETDFTSPSETTTTEFKPTGPPEHDCNKDDVDCIITETGDPDDWFKCPEDVGSHPHPSSNKIFIFCMNWIPSVKKCGQDLIFSRELLTCIETFL